MAMWRKRMQKHLFWALAGVGTVLFVLWWGPRLFTSHPDHRFSAEQQLKAENDVRTTLVQALGGLAVAGGAIVTYRTFRQNQLDEANRREEENRTYQLNLRDQEKRWAEQDRAYELNLASQVTDTYTKAVEQLGHEQAPVRLGALYSLERLAQDNPSRRQTVVDVLCAYLRMPYTPPDQGRLVTHGRSSRRRLHDVHTGMVRRTEYDPAQELQVRLTAQRLLADHLHPPPDTSRDDAQAIEASPEEVFWPGISLDLTNATLVNLSFVDVSVVDGNFGGATFSGFARFRGATFSGLAWFVGAIFSEEANFSAANFRSSARFNAAAFSGQAAFDWATFSAEATFSGASFFGPATFNAAAFSDKAMFGEAIFSDETNFSGAAFLGYAGFDAATFSGPTRFGGADFCGPARFLGATFSHDAGFIGVDIHYLDDESLNWGAPNGSRVWPKGWSVLAATDDRRHGTLVPTVGEGAGLTASPPESRTAPPS
jgi:uncharacterized protein YjbI with pentapeptide repeats